MITTKHGSIFDSTAQVLVCPVNCVGVMGKGLALEFKRRFPDACADYQNLCTNRRLAPGGVAVTSKRVVMFATKNSWRRPSQLKWIDAGLLGLHDRISAFGWQSIALPQLGCGCGGLDWADVWPLYEKHLSSLDCDVEVWIYE